MWTIILTRSEEESATWLSAQIKGVSFLCCPVVEYQPIADVVLPSLDRYRWLVLTSGRAAEIFYSLVSPDDCADLKIACVGARAAVSAGRCDVQGASAADLAEKMIPLLASGDRILHPCSAEARQELPDLLSSAGFTIDRVPLYRPEPFEDATPFLSALKRSDGVLFFAPSQVRAAFRHHGAGEALRHVTILAIGRTTAGAIPKPYPVAVLDSPTPEGLARVLEGGLHEAR
ncbi:MAG TPA: uroporphyrinogen-III synthase [Thermoanaerobaculia bacterium]|nr:uroporphyrinogen-III synthase [Thermoanaerobaculia bacterium]HXK66898.1 uroporphyrinogen-III synthase [Thermoanaerobaculia bacterium]